MVKLGVTVPYNPGETITSFTSRLSIRNRRPTVRTLCLDVGIRFQDIIEGAPEAVERVADLGGVEPAILAAAAFRKKDGYALQFKSQKIVASAINRSALKVCPACLLNDIRHASIPLEAAVYGRIEWQLTGVRTCRLHSTPLVDLGVHIPPGQTHDFARNFEPYIAGLEQLQPDQTREFSPFEYYLLERLFETSGTVDWIDGVGFSAATKACTVFGAVAEFGKQTDFKHLSDDQLLRASNTGLNILRHGYASALPFLQSLDDGQAARNGGPKALLGDIHLWLGYGNDDPEVEPIAAMIRDHVSRTLPIGSETELYGAPMPPRRLHSVATAAKEYGLHAVTLRKTLMGVGILDAQAQMDEDGSGYFDAVAHTPLLTKLKTAVSEKHARDHLRISRSFMESILRSGLIKPIVSGPNITDLYDPEDLDQFVATLLAGAVETEVPSPSLASIPDAAKQACCSTPEILHLITEKHLRWVGRHTEKSGYNSVLVNVDEIREHVQLQPLSGVPVAYGADDLGIKYAAWRKLLEQERFPTVTEINPINRCPTRVLTMEPYIEFKSRYVSLRDLSNAAGAFAKSYRRTLSERGVEPVEKYLEIGAILYDRSHLT
jgi:hypothetical protein